jgi:hypothetical protein
MIDRAPQVFAPQTDTDCVSLTGQWRAPTETLHLVTGRRTDTISFANNTTYGLFRCARDGRLPKCVRVLFIHAGGLPALFGYATELQRNMIGPEARAELQIAVRVIVILVSLYLPVRQFRERHHTDFREFLIGLAIDVSHEPIIVLGDSITELTPPPGANGWRDWAFRTSLYPAN